MDHPDVVAIERTGYPADYAEPEIISVDSLGNVIYEGDEILVLNDETFVIEPLLYETVEVLEKLGAERITA